MGLLSRTRDRRKTDRRTSDRRGGHAFSPHPFYADALKRLPSATIWAVAADAEFRFGGAGGLRGVLHHDGAILRFMTWGGVERFVGSPMEFEWELGNDGRLGITSKSEAAWFMNLTSLALLVPSPPAYAALSADDATSALQDWMRSWA